MESIPYHSKAEAYVTHGNVSLGKEELAAYLELNTRRTGLKNDISKMDSMLNSSEKAKYRKQAKSFTLDQMQDCIRGGGFIM